MVFLLLYLQSTHYDWIKWHNALRPRQNGRQFADDIFKCIFLNENVSIAIQISLKFVPKGPINNIPSLIKIMAWRRSGEKPLSEPMLVSLPTQICVTRPQCVNKCSHTFIEYNVCTRVASCLCAHERVIVVFISITATREINTQITLAHIQFVTRVHMIFHLLHGITSL